MTRCIVFLLLALSSTSLWAQARWDGQRLRIDGNVVELNTSRELQSSVRFARPFALTTPAKGEVVDAWKPFQAGGRVARGGRVNVQVLRLWRVQQGKNGYDYQSDWIPPERVTVDAQGRWRIPEMELDFSKSADDEGQKVVVWAEGWDADGNKYDYTVSGEFVVRNRRLTPPDAVPRLPPRVLRPGAGEALNPQPIPPKTTPRNAP